MTRLLDGKATAKVVRAEVADRVAALAARDVTVGLALVRVGDDPASESYVRGKARLCKRVGIRSELHELPADVGEPALGRLLSELNARDDVHGVLLQMPLPRGYDESAFLDAVRPEKDVDGFHPINVGRAAQGLPAFVPCTPLGIQRLLTHHDVPIEGHHVVVVGRSNLVGRPVATLLSQRTAAGNASVTLCHSRSRDLAALTRSADILIAAAGQRELITADMVAEGAVVVDVGIHRVEVDGAARLVGDVRFDEVAPRTSAISPVPGGVGPMTVVMLVANTVSAAERAHPPRS